MFKTLIDTLKKTFKIIPNMFTDDKIATAQIAQIFGSELLKVQNSATTDSGHQPNIVNINPQQFLVSSKQFQSSKKAEEQRLIQMLQREAEAAYPIAQPSVPESASQQQAPATQQAPVANYSPPQESVHHSQLPKAHSQPNLIPSNNFDAFERIACSLEQIASKLNNLDIVVKKKRTKRPIK